MRISDWSSDVCSSDLRLLVTGGPREVEALRDNPGLIGADLAKTRSFRRGKAWIAILCMAGVVTLAALEVMRSEEHTSELQSLMRISYAVFCLKKKQHTKNPKYVHYHSSRNTITHQ